VEDTLVDWDCTCASLRSAAAILSSALYVSKSPRFMGGSISKESEGDSTFILCYRYGLLIRLALVYHAYAV